MHTNTHPHTCARACRQTERSMWHESSQQEHRVIPPLCRRTIYLSNCSCSLHISPIPCGMYCISLHPPPLEINLYIYLCIFSRADIHLSPPTCLFIYFSCHPLLHLLSTAITGPISLPSLHHYWSLIPLGIAAAPLLLSLLPFFN